jgi:hypothetical protein
MAIGKLVEIQRKLRLKFQLIIGGGDFCQRATIKTDDHNQKLTYCLKTIGNCVIKGHVLKFNN